MTRLLITPRLVRQVSGAVARQLGVRAYPTIMWLQLMDEGVTIAEHAGGRDAASLVAFAKAAPGMIEEGVAAQVDFVVDDRDLKNLVLATLDVTGLGFVDRAFC